MTNTHTTLVQDALEFLRPHAAELRGSDADPQVRDCIAHLTASAGVSAATAREATLHALGELTSRGRREYIDCSRTTSYTLFLVDAAGHRHAFTIQDLIARLDLAARPARLN